MNHQIKKIGVLTSGGDAPGMNAAIYAIVRHALKSGIEVCGILDGYKGLVEGHIVPLTYNDVSGIMNRGGTILGTARLPEFTDAEVREIGIKQLQKNQIDAVICMGGLRLSEMGIPCIGVPGTIDNDIPSTEFTIGFDTCLNTIVDSVDKIRDTANSHHRCIIVEVMGRFCPDLAIRSGLACESEYIIYSKENYNEQEMLQTIKENQEKGKKDFVIILAEHTVPIHEIEKVIKENTNLEPRCTVLGHVQRGGRPSAFDRVLAVRLGIYAVDLILQGETGKCVGHFGEELVATEILKANELPKKQAQEIKPCVKKI